MSESVALEAYWPAKVVYGDWDSIAGKIAKRYRETHPSGKEADGRELAAWANSVRELASILTSIGLGQVWMFVEYRLDRSMAPIDVVLAGVHPETRSFSYAAIELKQWDRVEHACYNHSGEADWVFFPGYAGRRGKTKDCKHPAVQAYNNLIALRTRHNVFDDRSVRLTAAAYLHNLRDPEYQWIADVPTTGDAPTFTERTPAKLRAYLLENFSDVSGDEAVEELLNRRRATLPLQRELGKVVDGRTHFDLVEKQLEAFETVMDRLACVPAAGTKLVYVIEGRAGTGKSLIALELLASATAAGRRAAYVSGGIASRDTFRRGAGQLKSKFVPLVQIAKHKAHDELDLLVCDEAHRLTERPQSGSYSMLPGESSIAVIVDRAKVPVLFIDGDQRLFGEEVWTPEGVRQAIKDAGARPVWIRLERVVRALGSSTYDSWVRRLLAGDPLGWEPGDPDDPEPFQLYYADTPDRMERFLQTQVDRGASARMTAGLCWNWTDGGGIFPDVRVTSRWARPWNAGDNHSTEGVPRRKFWATDPGGFGQIGCVHTAQGLEYEWGGVIMGPDLRWSGTRWVEHRENVISKAKRITDPDKLNRALRNAYGVLMTRSMRGTVLYSTDPGTRELFAELGVPRCP